VKLDSARASLFAINFYTLKRGICFLFELSTKNRNGFGTSKRFHSGTRLSVLYYEFFASKLKPFQEVFSIYSSAPGSIILEPSSSDWKVLVFILNLWRYSYYFSKIVFENRHSSKIVLS